MTNGYRFALSPAQKRLWFLSNLRPDDCSYHVPLAVELEGEVNPEALEAAFRLLIDRHESLRTSFLEVDEEPVQFVALHVPWTLTNAESDSREEVLARMERDACQPLNLSQAPLLRGTLFRFGPSSFILYLNLHHLICDGWSLGILVRELGVCYTAMAEGKTPALETLALQYPDYSDWLREQDFSQHREYWQTQLKNPPDFRLQRRPGTANRGEVACSRLHPETVKQLEEFAGRRGATLFMVGLTAFHILLRSLSGAEDIVIGTPVANRPIADLESVVGLFVNSLPLRVESQPSDCFDTLLGRVKETCVSAFDHQELPFEQMLSAGASRRNPARSPLFQTMFVLQNAPMEGLSFPGITVAPLRVHNGSSKADLILTAEPDPEGLLLSLEFASDLFDKSAASQLLSDYEELLMNALKAPTRVLRAVSLPGASLRREYPVRDLAGWFEEVAREHGDAVALVCEDRRISYVELNGRANAEARWLRERGVGPEVRVGLCRERSIDLIIGMLAIVKAGGVYVPMDPQYPADRLDYLAQDSGVALVLQGEAPKVSEENLGVPVHPSQAAYVIYTSGSTGQPKGCVVSHANVSRLLESTRERFGFVSHDIWTMFHSPSFDFSVWEVWGALLTGARLVIVPYLVSRSPEAFWDLLQREEVTVLNQTPSAFRQLITLEGMRLPKLRLVIFGGEALDTASLDPWFARYGTGAELVNMYGITETTVHVTEKSIAPGMGNGIGGPLPDLTLYVLDEAMQQVPLGVKGEIYVGGAGVARGYLGQPGLTAERFIPDPFHATGGRLYRSGDMARWRAEGELEYLGRGDQQIKIRGFRMEPGEIEAALRKCAGVREAVVGELSGRLVAWVVAEQPEALRAQLKATLPEHMVPAAIVPLSAMPLTAHGKIDRRALPEPDWTDLTTETTRREPQTEAERTLAAIWTHVLGAAHVGIDDNFFALGGDSILALQVISRARREKLQLTVQDLFHAQTIAELARLVKAPPTPTIERPEGAIPLTPIQQWFFSQEAPNRSHWNQSAALEIPVGFGLNDVARALTAVASRHDVFRLRYRYSDSAWLQEYRGAPLLPVREAPIPQIQTSLNIQDGPLACAALWSEPSGAKILFLTAHHLIVDGVSWRILLEDVIAELKGQPPAAQTSTYGDWARVALQSPFASFAPAPQNREADAERWSIQIPLPKNFTMFSQMESLLLDALGPTELAIVRESHGRKGTLDLSRTVGWFTQFIDASGQPIQISGSVRALCFNYLGQFTNTGDDAEFRLRTDLVQATHDPLAQRPFELDVVAFIQNGLLTVTWIYGTQTYSQCEIRTWSDRCKRHLESSLSAFATPVRPLTSTERDAVRNTIDEPIDSVYPLTPLQQGMLFHTVSGDRDTLYFEQITATITGALDAQALERSANDVIAAHPALRTGFVWKGLGEPLQAVLTNVRVEVRQIDLSGVDENEKVSGFNRLLEQDRNRPFKLEQAPLLRIHVLRTGPKTWKLLWSHHHLILDGWSLPLVFLDLLRAYETQAQGMAQDLVPSPAFANYVRWIAHQDTARAEEFWKTTLSGCQGPSTIAPQRDNTGALPRHTVLSLALDPERIEKLTLAAQRHRVTVNTIVQATWALLLHRFGAKEDVIFGITVSGRNGDVADIERIPGLFINTLPLRIRVDRGSDLGGWLRGIQASQFALQEFTYCRLVDIQRWRGAPEQPLFDSLLVFENYPVSKAIGKWQGPIAISDFHIRERSNFPLTLGVIPGDGLTFQLNYHQDRLETGTPERLMDGLTTLLDRIGSSEDQKLGALLYPSETFVQTAPALGLPGHTLFERQAKETPNATALICGTRRISYSECDRRATQLARQFSASGVRPGDLVGISLARSEEFVISILATWKAGAAYLPLDLDLPAERLQYLMDDSGVRMVLRADTLLPEPLADDFRIEVTPFHLAYVIYTSGSTGRPKGVAVSHAGLENLMRSQVEAFRVKSDSRVLQFARFSFDASVSELLMALGCGAALVIPEPTGDPTDLDTLLPQYRITHVTLPPSVAGALAPSRFGTLKTLILAGEAAASELFLEWSEHCRVRNAYGPTETTVCASMNNEPHREAEPTIGDSAGWARICLLNDSLEPVPEDVPGEICVSGPGLAWGYWNQPDATAMAFVPHPFGAPGERLYRTGDFGVRNADGKVRFLGRRDQQIKVRGHRVELGEIETVIASHPDIESAAAIAVTTASGTTAVAGFYRAASPLDDGSLRIWMGRRLAVYQMPASLEYIAQWPLTASGKIDRNRLFPGPTSNTASGSQRVATSVETELLEIWREVLRAPHASFTDNFFALGGDSILSLQAASKARERGFAVSPRDILSLQTVEALAHFAGPAAVHTDLPGVWRGAVPLTPIQHWFFAQKLSNPHHWNMSLVLESGGPVNLASLEGALNEVAGKHDAFRYRFHPNGDVWQAILTDQTPPFTIEKPAATWDDGVAGLQCGLNLTSGPLFRAAFLESRLVFVAHHAIFDAISWSAFLSEVFTLYKNGGVAAPAYSYASWADRQRQLAALGGLAHQIPYWAEVVRQTNATGPLFQSLEPARLATRYRTSSCIVLDREDTQLLLTSGMPAPHALLTALILAIGGVFGRDRLTVDLEGHGREDSGDALDLSRSIGWFTSLYPVILKLPEKPSLDEAVRCVRDQLQSVPDSGSGYGILRWLHPDSATRNRLTPAAPMDVLFNYLGNSVTEENQATGFRLCDMSAGNEHSPDQPMSHALSVNARIRNGQLHVDFAASGRVFSGKLLDVLAAAYEARLGAVLRLGTAPEREHCATEMNLESLMEEIEI